MSKFAAIFAAAVLVITLGACASGQSFSDGAADSTSVVRTA